MSPKKNPESPDTITGGKARGTAMKKGPIAMIVTIVRNDTTKAGETAEVEERKSYSVFSTARTRAIGQMNAPLLLKEKKS